MSIERDNPFLARMHRSLAKRSAEFLKAHPEERKHFESGDKFTLPRLEEKRFGKVYVNGVLQEPKKTPEGVAVAFFESLMLNYPSMFEGDDLPSDFWECAPAHLAKLIREEIERAVDEALEFR